MNTSNARRSVEPEISKASTLDAFRLMCETKKTISAPAIGISTMAESKPVKPAYLPRKTIATTRRKTPNAKTNKYC
jgi:hypothetical protein